MKQWESHSRCVKLLFHKLFLNLSVRSDCDSTSLSLAFRAMFASRNNKKPGGWQERRKKEDKTITEYLRNGCEGLAKLHEEVAFAPFSFVFAFHNPNNLFFALCSLSDSDLAGRRGKLLSLHSVLRFRSV